MAINALTLEQETQYLWTVVRKMGAAISARDADAVSDLQDVLGAFARNADNPAIRKAYQRALIVSQRQVTSWVPAAAVVS